MVATGQEEVDGVPEGRNANQPPGYAPRENRNDSSNRTAGENGVLVDERRMVSGVRRASIPGEHDEVGLAGKRRVDGKEGGVSTNKSSTPDESSRSRMKIVSACSDNTAAPAGSGYVCVGLQSKGGARETTTAAAKAVVQGPKRVAGFSVEDNGGRVSSGVVEKTLVGPVNDSDLLLPQPQRRHSAGGERNGAGNKSSARDRRRSSEPPPTATYSRSALGTMGENPASIATTEDIPPAAFDCLPARGGRYHSSKNGRPAKAKVAEIYGKGQSDGVEQQQFGGHRGKRVPSGAGRGAEFSRARATLDNCAMAGSKGDDRSLGTDGRNARSGGSGREVAMSVVTEPVGGMGERELGACVDARGDCERALLGDEDSSKRSYGRVATVWGGVPERKLDMSVDASADSTLVDAVASEEDSSAVRVGAMVLPLHVASRGKSVPREGIVPGGVPPAGDVKKGQAIEVADSVATGSTLSLSGPATNERSPDTGYADSAGVEGYCPPEGARDDITLEKRCPPSFSPIMDTREQDLSDGRFLLQRGRPNDVGIAIDGDSCKINGESPLVGLGGLSPGAGAVSSENGSREEGREDSRLSGGYRSGDGNVNGGFMEGSSEASAMDGSGGGQQEKHNGGSSAPAVGGVRPSVSTSSGGGKKEEERDTLGGKGDLGGESESEDEEFNYSIKTDHFGFFVTSERRGPEVPPEVARLRRLKEGKRSGKWRTMMANFGQWRSGRKGKRFRKRVRKGIPDCVRGKVWQMMSGSLAMMEKEPNMYADLVASDLPVDGPIEEDIPRTMYDHEMFCRKSRVDGRSMLRRVLTAYGRYDREVQYCQGINYICALFLLYMPEENAFWLLVASMNREQAPLRDLFLPGMVKAQEFQYVVDSLTEKYCHELSAQIIRYNLTPAMYATQWFLTAFTQRFPYEFVTRIWDIFLLEDWKVFYRVCLALFKSVEDQAVKLDLENMNLLLRNMPLTVGAEEILNIANGIPLKHRHVEKRMAAFHRVRGRK